MAKFKRTAREIKVSDRLINNKNINIKVGTVENRESPETIYIILSFWLQPKNEYKSKEQDFLKNILNQEFKKIYSNSLKPILQNSKYFPKEKENIYIKNIPENLNYNLKRNFISIELYLHTCNIVSETKLSLNCKKNTELFKEAVKIGNIIGNSSVLNELNMFEISKKSS